MGARARAKSLEVSEYKFVFSAAPTLFLAIALAPSASEPSPVLVVAALWLYPPAPPGSVGNECPMVAPTSPGSGGQGSTAGVLWAGVGARARKESLEMIEFKFVCLF